VTTWGDVELSNINLIDDNGTEDTADDFAPDAVVGDNGFNVGDTDADDRLDPGESWLFSAMSEAVEGEHRNTVVVAGDDGTGVTYIDADDAGYWGAVDDKDDQDDKDDEKSDDKSDEKSDEQSDDKSDEKSDDKSDAKSDDKSDHQTGFGNWWSKWFSSSSYDKDDDKSDDKSDHKSDEKSDDKDDEKSDRKSDDKSDDASDKGDKSDEKSDEKSDDKSDDRSDDKGDDDNGDKDEKQDVAVPDYLKNQLDDQPFVDADEPTGPIGQVGDMVKFKFVVTNPGDVDLVNVVVTDNNETPGDTSDDFSPDPVLVDGFNVGDVNQDGRLNPGEQWLYTAMKLVEPGQHKNIAKVTGEDESGTMVMDDDPAHWLGESDPGIEITKWVLDPDGDDKDGDEGLSPGFWSTHSRFGPAPEKLWPATGLDPDDSYEAVFGFDVPGISGSYTLHDALTHPGGSLNQLLFHSTAALLNASHPDINYAYTVDEVTSLTEKAIADGGSAIDDLKDEFDLQNNKGADEDDDKSDDNGDDKSDDKGDGPEHQDVFHVGDKILFRYEVRNTGDVALANIAVTDDNATPNDTSDDLVAAAVDEDGDGFNDGDLDEDNLLDLDETWLFEAMITAETAGDYMNTASVLGTSEVDGEEVSDEDDAKYWIKDKQDDKDDKDDKDEKSDDRSDEKSDDKSDKSDKSDKKDDDKSDKSDKKDDDKSDKSDKKDDDKSDKSDKKDDDKSDKSDKKDDDKSDKSDKKDDDKSDKSDKKDDDKSDKSDKKDDDKSDDNDRRKKSRNRWSRWSRWTSWRRR